MIYIANFLTILNNTIQFGKDIWNITDIVNNAKMASLKFSNDK